MRVLFLGLIFLSCAYNENYGPNAEANRTQFRVYTNSFEEVYRAVIQEAAENNRWEVITSDNIAGYIKVKYEQYGNTWGDTVNLTISELDGKIRLIAKSELGQEPNRNRVQDFLNSLNTRLNETTI